MFVQGSTENQFYWVDSLFKNYDYNYMGCAVVALGHMSHHRKSWLVMHFDQFIGDISARFNLRPITAVDMYLHKNSQAVKKLAAHAKKTALKSCKI